jgi:hypothetical protein
MGAMDVMMVVIVVMIAVRTMDMVLLVHVLLR